MPDEIVELSGHLIDSFTLSKVLDTILKNNACYEIQKIKVGISVKDTSFARIRSEEHTSELQSPY